MEPWVVSTTLIFVYLIATIVIGVLANRKGTASMEDFFLFGRQAGFVVLYLTVVATFHSAFALPGVGRLLLHPRDRLLDGRHVDRAGRRDHLHARHAHLGARQEVRVHHPADMIADFYESEAVRLIVAGVSVLFTLIYIQVQAAGLGYILSVATGDRISFELASLILLVVRRDTSWSGDCGPYTGPT